MKKDDIFNLNDYSEGYQFAIKNNLLIQEINADEKGKRQFKFVENKIEYDEAEYLRGRREYECFTVVNRGKLWYDQLNEEQHEELKVWYNNWLNAPESLIAPEKPNWLN